MHKLFILLIAIPFNRFSNNTVYTLLRLRREYYYELTKRNNAAHNYFRAPKEHGLYLVEFSDHTSACMHYNPELNIWYINRGIVGYDDTIYYRFIKFGDDTEKYRTIITWNKTDNIYKLVS